jgi:ferrous-iron efflux pump FieF
VGLLAARLGTLFIAWGQTLAAPLAAIVVATIIAVNAIGLFRENSSFLLGRSPGPEYLARIESLARSVPGVLDVRDLRTEYIGPGILHAGMHIEVQRDLPIEEADRIPDELDAWVHQGIGAGHCIIRVNAAEPKKVYT